MRRIISSVAATVLATALLATAPTTTAASAATAPRLHLGVYNCFDLYNDLLGNVKLISRSRYEYAYSRRHARLINPVHGRYHTRARTMIFTSGTFHADHLYGRIHRRTHRSPYFELFSSDGHVSTGYSCYYLPHP